MKESIKIYQLASHFLLILFSSTVLSSCRSQREKVIGVWHLTSACSRNDVTLMFDSQAEFLKDGSYHKIGKMRGIRDSSSKNTDVVFSYESTGDWLVSENHMIEKLIDFKLKLEYFTKNGEVTQGSTLNQEVREEIASQMGASVKKGLSSELSILDLSENKISLKYKNSENALAAGSCEKQEYIKQGVL
jgi:hypothetical protein